MAVITVAEIHIALPSELPDVKSRIIRDYESGYIEDNWAAHHVWREFNKRCIVLQREELLKTPHGAGGRPTQPQPLDYLRTIDGKFIEVVENSEKISRI